MSDDLTSSATDPDSSGTGEASSARPTAGKKSNLNKPRFSRPNFNSKKPYFRNNRSSAPNSARRGGAAYTKDKPRGNGLLTSPARPYFPVFVSTLGCESFVLAVYNWCIGKDYRFGTSVPVYSMQYATTIAFYARLAIVNEKYGTRIDSLTSRLKSVSRGILLPHCICKMIEAVGVLQRPGQPTVIPLFPVWEQVQDNPVLADPRDYLTQAGRDVPEGDWAIDTQYLAEYINHCARGESRNLGFRTVDYDVHEGRLEMLYGYSRGHMLFAGDLIPAGPAQALQSEAELGAAYCFRDHDHPDLWLPAANHLVQPDYLGTQFTVPTFVAHLAGEHSRNPRQ